MRNIEKMIESYQEWQKTHRGGIGDFTAMDGYNLKEISHGEYWETMFNSLYVGFIAGYRRAKKDAKEAASKRKKPTKKEVELFRSLWEGATEEAKAQVKALLSTAADYRTDKGDV